MVTPNPDGPNGRGARGRFGPGNQAAKGRPNPHAKRVSELRSAFLEAVTPDDIREVVAALKAQALEGNVQAARVLLDRVLGPPEAVDVAERLSEVEALLEGAVGSVMR